MTAFRFIHRTMKLIKLIIIFCFQQLNQNWASESSEIIPQAITSVFINCPYNDVSIIKSIDQSVNMGLCNDWIREIATTIKSNKSLRIEDVKHDKSLLKKCLKRNCVIVLIDTFESFFKFQENFSPDNYNTHGFYLIASVDKLSNVIAEKVLAMLWSKMIFNVAVIQEDKETIVLLTFFPFRDGSCNNTKAVNINEFNISSNQWKSEVHFPRKFKDMQKCSLRVGTYESQPGLMIEAQNETTKLYGFEGDMFTCIADRLNFVMNVTVVSIPSGTVFENGSATGLVGKLLSNEFDLVLSLLSVYYFRTVYLSATSTYYVDQFILIIPADSLLDPFLKLFYVFDFALWMTLIIIFMVSSVILYFMQSENIQLNYLSLLIAFVGGSEKKVPKRNFPRILMAMFLLFFLVVRSIYQGALFNVLKRDVFVSKIKTIDDINRLQYTFYMTEGMDVKTKDLNISNK